MRYYDSSELDSITPARRAEFRVREAATMIATWNPEKWNPDDWETLVYAKDVATIAAGGLLRGRWSTGPRKSGIEPGDRVFLLRQGVEPRGVIGSGTVTSRIFPDSHWDEAKTGDDANYVLIEWDTLVLPDDGLPHADLVERIPAGGIWRPQAGGWVPDAKVAAELEALWAEHLGRAMPPPARSTPRQGWQMDPVRRRKVEDAAQNRLMAHYRDRGWTVHDVRFGNPYDAIATKNGRTLWLEAKGTETAGDTVIVSRNEVRWAKEHPGDCVLGILSNVVFRPDGEVDAEGGVFRVMAWNPDDTVLKPRSFDLTPTPVDAPE
ncbi:DUF3883 domain-containing protein [Catellatospora coxensis]